MARKETKWAEKAAAGTEEAPAPSLRVLPEAVAVALKAWEALPPRDAMIEALNDQERGFSRVGMTTNNRDRVDLIMKLVAEYAAKGRA